MTDGIVFALLGSMCEKELSWNYKELFSIASFSEETTLHWIWYRQKQLYSRALWFWTFFEFRYGQAGSSVCYRNLEVWLYAGLLRSCWNPPRNSHRVWKIQQWLKKEDFSTFIDSFEINTPRQLFIQPCVTKTERYGYIQNYGGCVEPSYRTTIGCEKG